MVFFERCVKSVSLIGDSVDRTAETQVNSILIFIFVYGNIKFFIIMSFALYIFISFHLSSDQKVVHHIFQEGLIK